MFKNAMSKAAWVITLAFACIYIFSSLGTILTDLMDASTAFYMIITLVFVSSVAKVILDIVDMIDGRFQKNEDH